MALKLFEYAVILQPLQDKNGKTVEEGQILVGVETVLAKDETQVQLLASRAIPEDQMNDLDRLQVVVRPFDLTGDEYDDNTVLDNAAFYGASHTLMSNNTGSGINFYTSSPTTSSSYTSLSNITSGVSGDITLSNR